MCALAYEIARAVQGRGRAGGASVPEALDRGAGGARDGSTVGEVWRKKAPQGDHEAGFSRLTAWDG